VSPFAGPFVGSIVGSIVGPFVYLSVFVGDTTMKTHLGAQCDEFYTNSRLFLKLNLSLERETVLHFFERVRREFPSMRRFRTREDGALILEEGDVDAREAEPKRWIRLEPGSLRFGYFAPPSAQACQEYADFLLEQAPYHLTLSDLDVDHLETVYGFDLEYCGNHDRLVAETLFADHPLSAFLTGPECAHTIDCQPYFGIALSDRCDTQAFLEVKSRTTSFEVRTGEYEPQILSVYLTVRRYWGLDDPGDLATAHRDLSEAAYEVAADRVVPLIVNPLALAIASRPT